MFAALVVATMAFVAMPTYGQECEMTPDDMVAPPMPPSDPPQPPMMPPGNDDVDMRELMQDVMAARLARELGFNNEQTVLLVKAIGEYKQQLEEARKQRNQVARELRAAINANESDSAIDAKLNELIQQDLRALELKKTGYTEFSRNLTVPQKAKLYLFMTNFESDMRKLVQQARQRHERRIDRGPESPGEEPKREGPRRRRAPAE